MLNSNARRRAMPLLFAASLLILTACSSSPTVVRSRVLETDPVKIPMPPAELMEPESSASYLELVRTLLLDWAAKLKGSKES